MTQVNPAGFYSCRFTTLFFFARLVEWIINMATDSEE
jgi:hypothetical protein